MITRVPGQGVPSLGSKADEGRYYSDNSFSSFLTEESWSLIVTHELK